jgi:hypothetical protein
MVEKLEQQSKGLKVPTVINLRELDSEFRPHLYLDLFPSTVIGMQELTIIFTLPTPVRLELLFKVPLEI